MRLIFLFVVALFTGRCSASCSFSTVDRNLLQFSGYFLLFLAFFSCAESRAIPVGKEEQKEDVVCLFLLLFEQIECFELKSRLLVRFLQVKRCLVEVLSKALSKPDTQLHQECKDIIQAGLSQNQTAKNNQLRLLFCLTPFENSRERRHLWSRFLMMQHS